MRLPRPPDSNGLIVFKLIRKVDYRIHVIFEPVRASFVKFLKQFNHLYSDIEINVDNIPEGSTGLGEEKDYIEEIMTKNISQPIPIIPELNFLSDKRVTNESSNIHSNFDKKRISL